MPDFDLDKLKALAAEVNITPEDVKVPLDEIPADSTCITFQRARAMEFLSAKG